jgi:hypothetical protein
LAQNEPLLFGTLDEVGNKLVRAKGKVGEDDLSLTAWLELRRLYHQNAELHHFHESGHAGLRTVPAGTSRTEVDVRSWRVWLWRYSGREPRASDYVARGVDGSNSSGMTRKGNTARAHDIVEEALMIARQIGPGFQISFLLVLVGDIATRDHDWDVYISSQFSADQPERTQLVLLAFAIRLVQFTAAPVEYGASQATGGAHLC